MRRCLAVRRARSGATGLRGGPTRSLLMGMMVTATVALAACGSSSTNSSSTSTSSGTNLGSSYNVASAGKSTLTIWWLGNQEIPGIQTWMKNAITAYEGLHPNVTVNTVLENTETYTATQKTACRGGAGPDIWYNWGGVWSLQVAWEGCTLPNEAVLSPSDISNVPAVAGTKWDGKTWVYPVEQRLYPIIYNKALFAKAGISTPPVTWTEFLADSAKLKSAGIQPLVTGLKNGFGGENLAVAIERQVLPVSSLIHDVVNATMNTPEWKEWLEKAYSLKPYFNNDVNSINYSQGLARFEAGKAGMIFASPGWRQDVTAMDKEGKSAGIFKVPVYSSNPDASKLYEDTPGFQVTKFAKNPQLAGSFLAFLHTSAELNEFYSITGDVPSDSRWHPTVYKSPIDAQLLKWLGEGIDYYSANYYPTSSIDENGNFVVFQGMYGGSTTVDQALKIYQTEIEKWQTLEPAELADYKSWLKEY